MYKGALRPAWVEINLNNLDFNIKNIKTKIGDREMIGVIKADAYGHGSVKVAEVLRANGCKTFAIEMCIRDRSCRYNGKQRSHPLQPDPSFPCVPC